MFTSGCFRATYSGARLSTLLSPHAGPKDMLGMAALPVSGKIANRPDSTAPNAVAGPYLADQLLLPFALAGGGGFTTVKPSQHARTAADIIDLYTGRRVVFAQQAAGEHLVSITP
jgi:RNA 3'-terminal phosphate cyclase (ATP)